MKKLLVFGVAAVLLLNIDPARAQWQPVLVEPEGGERQADSEIRVQLPPEVTMETLQWLGLEIDGIDVSEIVGVEETERGFVVVVSPPKPLDTGSHAVRLVEYTRDGRVATRGMWTIHTGGDVRKSLAAQATADLAYRVRGDSEEAARDTRQDEVVGNDDYQGNGAAAISGNVATNEWIIEGDVQVLYSSEGIGLGDDPDDLRSGNDLDIGEYLVTRRGESTELNLGHHSIGYDSLIMEDFYRRGVSATGIFAEGKAAGTLFAMRTEPVIGSDDILGISKEESRVVGGVGSVSPFPDERLLTFSVAGLTGKGTDESGTSLSGRDLIAEGNAASIAAESQLMNERLRLRGEYAETRYDFDGLDGGLGDVRDNARMLSAEYDVLEGRTLGDYPADLTFGAEYRRTGLFFKSIANSFLPPDKDQHRLYGNFRWGGLLLSAASGEEHDNVDDAPEFPRLGTELHEINLNYTPPAVYTDEGELVTPWYGRPSLSAGLQYGRQELTRLPEDAGFVPIDKRTRTFRVFAGFYYPKWNWYLGHTVGYEDDLTFVTPDIRNEISSLGVSFSLMDRVSTGLRYQYNRIRESNGDTTRLSAWGADLNAVFIPDKLAGRLSYSMSLDRTSDDSFSTNNALLSFEISWQVFQSREDRPGMVLFLRGDLQNFDDRLNSGNDRTPSQVYAGVRVDWSAPDLLSY